MLVYTSGIIIISSQFGTLASIILLVGSVLSALAWVSIVHEHEYTVEPPSKGHFGTNINSGHLSFVERLSLFRGIQFTMLHIIAKYASYYVVINRVISGC